MGSLGTPLVAWLAQMADGVIGERARRTLLVLSSGESARDLHPPFLQQPRLRVLAGRADGEAWEIAVTEQPSLIVLEINSSGASGIGLCRRLRTRPETRSIPMIAIAEAGIREAVERLRPAAILGRPIVRAEYFDAVSRFVTLPRRRHARHPIDLRFTYVARGRFRQASSRHLSLCGAFLATDAVLREGARFSIDFHLPGEEKEIRCGAVVRHSTPYDPMARHRAGMAIEFEAIRERDLRRLERFIKRRPRGASLST